MFATIGRLVKRPTSRTWFRGLPTLNPVLGTLAVASLALELGRTGWEIGHKILSKPKALHMLSSYRDKTDIVQHATLPAPGGPAMSADLASRADRLELWVHSLEKPTQGRCEFRLFQGGQLLDVRYTEGT